MTKAYEVRLARINIHRLFRKMRRMLRYLPGMTP
jgi:hypothetical protein